MLTMLVMRRRAGESFIIGDEIEIEVLEVTGTRVKLGIVAPDSLSIVRKEARSPAKRISPPPRASNPSVIASLLPTKPPANYVTASQLEAPTFGVKKLTARTHSYQYRKNLRTNAGTTPI